jgi:hypothetical protein
VPKFSAFNPFGQLRFSSRPSHSAKIYAEMVKLLGGGKNYSDDFDSLAMARVYANAMAFGRLKYALERAASQFRPSRVLELLPDLEREYGLVPEATATIPQRRAELVVAAWVARGGRRSNVEAILTQLFGAGAVEYVTIAIADAVMSAGAPESRGVYVLPGAPRMAFRLNGATSRTGVAVSLQATLVAGDGPAPAVGSRVVVDPNDHSRVEAVTVEATTLVGSLLTITATFTKAHAAGAVVVTGRHPNIVTNKRHNIFIVSTAAARDNKTRRRLDRAAYRLLRGVSTWSITDGSGPFKVGVGRLGVTTIGAVT